MTNVLSVECHLIEPLTPREAEVLALLADGLSDKEIGSALNIAPITVRGDHKQNIYDKLGLQSGYRNRKWAVHCARQLGLLADIVDDTDEMLPGDNPYKGLGVFQPDDANVFFGREAFIEQLLHRLGGNGAVPRFLAVVGPSGSGKSSVVRAGLVPALGLDKIPGSSQWLVAIMTPHINPFHELETVLPAIAVKQQPDLLDLLQRDAYGLSRVARLILPESRPLLLIIDQFEELFTLVEDQAKARQFIDLLYAAVTDPRSTVRVVITLRADFLDRPLMYPDFSWLVQTQTEMVIPLTPDELERTITLPAEQARVTVEPGLVAKLVAEANEQPGALPLLQFALTELYDHRVGNTITLETYHEIGGLQQILATQADQILDSFDEAKQEATRQLFLYLITLGEGTEDVRRRVTIRDLESLDIPTETMQYVIQFLAANRLLTLDVDPATGVPSVEVAHEALIREWGQLRSWLDESRNDVRMERLLAGAANEWQRHNNDESYLMRGARLAQFEGWRETTDLALTDVENKFLDASLAGRDRRLRQRRLLRNVAAVVIIIVAVVMGVLALTATDARNQAEESEQEALRQASIGLAAQAIAELESDTPERGVLLALEALENYPYTPQAERALAQIVYETHHYTPLTDPEYFAVVFNTEYSPDGTLIATAGDEQVIGIWDSGTGTLVSRLNVPPGDAHENQDIRGVDWASDSSVLVTSSTLLGIARVWDVDSGDLLLSYEGHNGAVNSVYVSNDGSLALTASSDNTSHIWDLKTGDTIQIIAGHEAAVTDGIWSPDNTQIATASADGTLRLWDVETGDELLVIDAHSGGVLAAAWSPDGRLIASAGKDGLAQVWNVTTGEVVRTLIGHDDWVHDVEWSPDAAHLATSSTDGTARIWRADNGSEMFTLRSGGPQVTNIDWSPDGQTLAWAAQLSIGWWDVSTPIVRLVGHGTSADGQTVIGFSEWSSDGSIIHTNSDADQTSRIWDPITGEQLAIFEESAGSYMHPSRPEVLLQDPPRIWNYETDETVKITDDFDGRNNVKGKWSPDGNLIYLMSFGNPEYGIYDAESGEQLFFSTVEPCNFALPASWSPDSRYLAHPCIYDGETPLLVTEALTGDMIRELHGHTGGISIAQWSPDGRRIATASPDTTARIWDFQNGKTLTVFTGHTDWVFYVGWSPNGERLSSGDVTSSVRIWDAATGQEVNRFNADDRITEVPWSPDGTRILLTGGFPVPEIRPVWQSTRALIEYAYECCVFRELTPEERQQFGLP